MQVTYTRCQENKQVQEAFEWVRPSEACHDVG